MSHEPFECDNELIIIVNVYIPLLHQLAKERVNNRREANEKKKQWEPRDKEPQMTWPKWRDKIHFCQVVYTPINNNE